MNRIEASEDTAAQRPRLVEQIVIELHEVQAAQQLAGSRRGGGPMKSYGSDDLNPRQGARGAIRFGAEEPPERSGFRLSDDQLHECG